MMELSISRPARVWNGEDFTIAEKGEGDRWSIFGEPHLHGAKPWMRTRAETNVQPGDVIAIPRNLVVGA